MKLKLQADLGRREAARIRAGPWARKNKTPLQPWTTETWTSAATASSILLILHRRSRSDSLDICAVLGLLLCGIPDTRSRQYPTLPWRMRLYSKYPHSACLLRLRLQPWPQVSRPLSLSPLCVYTTGYLCYGTDPDVSQILAIGFLLVILSCALWKQYLPLLVVATYVLAPLPNWICGRCSNPDDFMESTGSAVVDFGRFCTAFLVVMGVGMLHLLFIISLG